MDSRLIFLHHCRGVDDGVTEIGWSTGGRKCPIAGGGSPQVNPRHQDSNPGDESFLRRSDLKVSREKPRFVLPVVTVLKLTQVGGVRILRRSGELWLRNSAKLPRNFGIRGACLREAYSGGARAGRSEMALVTG